MASALAKQHHARIQDGFAAAEKTPTDPSIQEASLAAGDDHVEDANRPTATVNTAKLIP
jgi:hypothetical protein